MSLRILTESLYFKYTVAAAKTLVKEPAVAVAFVVDVIALHSLFAHPEADHFSQFTDEACSLADRLTILPKKVCDKRLCEFFDAHGVMATTATLTIFLLSFGTRVVAVFLDELNQLQGN